MPDQALEIQIKTLADTYGAEKINEALKGIKQETGELTISHHELGAAVRGLRHEFPELYHVAHLALHPISLAVAGIGAAVAIWKTRMEELQSTFANLALPDLKPLDVGHINAVTAAWEKYNDELRKSVEASNSVEKQTERALKAIEDRINNVNKLMDATQARDKAEREAAGKGTGIGQNLAETDTGLVDKFNRERIAENQKLGEKEREAANLEIQAQLKRTEASHIKIASAEDDAETNRQLKEQASVAQKDIAQRKEKIDALGAFQAGEDLTAAQRVTVTKILGIGGTSAQVPQAIEEQRQGIEAAQSVIDRTNARLREQHERDRERARRDELLGEAAKLESQAREKFNALPEEYKGAAARTTEARAVSELKRQEEAFKALKEANDLSTKTSKDIAEAIKNKEAVSADMITTLKETQTLISAIQDHIRFLRTTNANLRNPAG